MEKFQYMVIAQDLETPHDSWGFEDLRQLEDDVLLITTLVQVSVLALGRSGGNVAEAAVV
jgi:hypothetical protein